MTSVDTDTPVIRCTSKHSANFYIRAVQNFLNGMPAKGELSAKAPVDHLEVTGLAAAITHAVAAATATESAGIGKIVKIRTDIVMVRPDYPGGQVGEEHGRWGIRTCAC
ncbi:hypothetical protein Pmar_PMAR020325 [Perkinsus marinus ATCC 50983]|uniref:Uncharacterized protein n=1 Tax=Perkinsus marinus (strain ATCC 50983 / TXsc) TaxID=423536 RepID=C5KFD7_PERM5|nr:hypothetical protein Pmar_PMAR020325 [Perkinsus marinus ATCC 50983]EER16797.1 hypothetical protein Pmar_PMAR020325 [Perkinsus marinus ATCC 50983]|eukprot:XP_002785001.1 hypothetical protein Pmar_PMAR020325 [Perkinsus marinus ATCC 50983]